jgi:hypothetical protein
MENKQLGPNPSGLCICGCGRIEHIEKRWGHYRQTNLGRGFERNRLFSIVAARTVLIQNLSE